MLYITFLLNTALPLFVCAKTYHAKLQGTADRDRLIDDERGIQLRSLVNCLINIAWEYSLVSELHGMIKAVHISL